MRPDYRFDNPMLAVQGGLYAADRLNEMRYKAEDRRRQQEAQEAYQRDIAEMYSSGRTPTSYDFARMQMKNPGYGGVFQEGLGSTVRGTEGTESAQDE